MKPIQRLLDSEKDRTYRKASLKYWNEAPMTELCSKEDYKDLKLAAGIFEESDYSYLTNPFGFKDEKYKAYAAKLRNFDFISSIFLRWLSEYNQRVFEPIVYTKNSNFDNEKLEFNKKLVTQSLQQRFVNMLIESGAFDPSQVDEAGNQVQPPMSPEVIKNQVSSLKDLKTIQGQHALDYIVDKQDIHAKFRKLFDYFIKINKFVAFTDTRFDHVIFETVSPFNVRYYGDKTYLEDCEAITVDYYLGFSDLIEIFGDTFKEYKKEYGDIYADLERQSGSGGLDKSGGSVDYLNDIFRRGQGIVSDAPKKKGDKIQVRHIQFTSFRKVKKVLDAEGNVLELTEDYQGDDVIEETWYPEEREGWVINNRYFIGGHAVDFQRRDADNPFSTKKNYNGRIFMSGEIEQINAPQRLFQYQEAHNAVQWKMQSAINKDKGKFLTLPLSLLQGFRSTTGGAATYYTGEADLNGMAVYASEDSISNSPREQESSVATSLYYADATQVLFLDDSAEGFANAINGIKQVDLSLGNWIEWLATRADKLKADAENLLGFNNARTGGIKSSDSVTNAQQNLYSGSLITEEYFTEFEEAMAKLFQGMLDYSKVSFKTGFTSNYVRSNMDVALLKIDELFSEASYGIFVRSSAKTKEVLDNLKAQATQILQNSPKGGSTMIKVFSNSVNFASLAQEIEAKENEFLQNEEANKQADRESNERMAQLAEQSKQADRDLKKYDIDSRQETEIMKSGIMGAGFNVGKEGGEDIATSIIQATNDMLDKAQKNNLKAIEINSKEKIATQNNKTKLEVANKQLSIARENKGQ